MAAAVLAAACSEQALEISVVPVEEAPESGSHKVFYASFDEGTKTTLSFNESGSHADVLWEAGDQIRVCGIGEYNNSAALYAYNLFATQDGGSEKASFYCLNWNPSLSSRICALYPAALWPQVVFYFKDQLLDHALCVPPVQQAVAGGLESGLSIATAFNDSVDTEDFHFKNVLSLVRFRLEGSSVGEVTKVRFQTNRPLSGDLLYCPEIQEFDLDGWYDVAYGGHQYYVDLTGPFEAGKDYYMAMVPGTSQGFNMLFYNDRNQVILKSSKKTIEQKRSRIADFGTITLGAFGDVPDGGEIYMKHTKGSKGVCLAVIGDGFTASEQSLFFTRAHEAIDALFETEPYKTYRDYFTVYIMPAVSKESGASATDGQGNIVSARDTYFTSRWGTDSYGDMRSDFDVVFDFVAARCPEILDGTFTLDEVPILLLINDTRYGGMCWTWGTGRCVGHVPYPGEGGGLGWGLPSNVAISNSDIDGGLRDVTQSDRESIGGNIYGDWRNIVIHEFGGHGIGRLTDEYWGGTGVASGTEIAGHSNTVPMGLNISGTYDNVPWQSEVLDELESGRYFTDFDKLLLCAERNGKFQGAEGYPLGRWRSEFISCMIDNRPYFSLWQRMLIVKRIMSLSGDTFDLQDFYSKDVPYDPARDLKASGAPAYRKKAAASAGVKIYPMLPSPRIVDE